MSERSDLDRGSLLAYVAGASDQSPAEREAVERWLEEHPEHRVVAARLRAAWQMIQPAPLPPLDVEGLRQRIWQQVGLGADAVSSSASSVDTQDPVARPVAAAGRVGRWKSTSIVGAQNTMIRRFSYGVAAGVLAVLGVVIGWRGGERHAGGHRGRAVSTYMTASGQRATITLPDGNTVALNVASRLDVPTDYLAGNRTLRLRGAALFTVRHHAGAPFTVLTGNTATRVLGTSFVVRQYAEDTATVVAVRDGKVAVGRTVVTARQLVEVGRRGTALVRPADASLFSFATGVLTLNSMRLADAVPELDRWFDADVRLGDPALADRLMYGRFTAGSIAELSEILQWTFKLRVTRAGRVLTLYPDGR